MKKFLISLLLISNSIVSISQTNIPGYLTVGHATDWYQQTLVSQYEIKPYGGSDGQTLEIHSTKLNVGQLDYETQPFYAPTSAIFNVATVWDGSEMVRLRTITNTSYFNMTQVLGGRFAASFVQDGMPQLYLSPYDNKVGIGTSAPNAKLDVNGNVYIGAPDATTATQINGYSLAVNGTAIFNRAKVKVYGNWPDYVFYKDYALPSLPELEKFIQLNEHLPEAPTELDVEKNGIDLGANQTLLLKKVEELTLYIIDLQKQINELKKNNK